MKARNHSRVASALPHSEGIAYKPPCGEIVMCLRVGRKGPIKRRRTGTLQPGPERGPLGRWGSRPPRRCIIEFLPPTSEREQCSDHEVHGMIGRIEETSASFEARSAPRSYPTTTSLRERKLLQCERFISRNGNHGISVQRR